jgi:hypothetical protein
VTTLLSVTYNGTSGDALTTYDAAYSRISGTATATISDAGRCRTNGTASNIKTDFTPGVNDYKVSEDFVAITDGTAFRLGLIGRYIDANNYIYMRYAGSTTGLQLFRRVGGVNTQMGSTYAYAIGTGNTDNLALVCDGDDYSVQLDGVDVIGPITYAGMSAPGQTGIYDASSSTVNNTAGVHHENFLVEDLAGGGVDGTASGANWSVTVSWAPGTADGTQNPTVAGADWSVGVSWSAGGATGDAGSTDGTAPGANWSTDVTWTPGTAEGTQNPTVDGASWNATVGWSAGGASSSAADTAAGANWNVGVSWNAGGATGQQDGNAPGASWNVDVGFNGGGASGVERLSTINLGVTHTGQLIILP